MSLRILHCLFCPKKTRPLLRARLRGSSPAQAEARLTGCLGVVTALVCVMNVHAAVIRGSVVEHATGKFLARAVVTVQPVAPTPGTPVSGKTNVSGLFEFAVVPGTYVVKVARAGFMPVEYGQRRWNSAGLPFAVDESMPAFLQIRMPRWGSISGSVVDENDIGLPEHEVVAYKNTQPPKLVAKAKSDERGVYRISELEPGRYLVRTAAAQYDEGSYLPTFGRESLRVDNARVVDVDLDQQVEQIDVRPIQGRLFTVTGLEESKPPMIPVNVTLATEMGRQMLTTTRDFQFPGVAPGPIEVYADAPVDNNSEIPVQGAYQASNVRDNGVPNILLKLSEGRGIDIRGGPANGLRSGTMQLWVRRKDLAGVGEAKQLKGDRQLLTPGHWELRLIPPPGFYVSSFSGSGARSRSRPDGWNEVTFTGYVYATFTVTAGGGSLSGIVKNGADVASGAPVFLEPWDDQTRARVSEMRSARTDLHGAYTFKDLPPGNYRVLSTFEYRDPDSEAFDLSAAVSVRVDAQGAVQRDLELWGIK